MATDRTLDIYTLSGMVSNLQSAAESGYEYTGGFTDRTTGTTGTDLGTNVEYTAAMVADDQWLRFGFDSSQQVTNDQPYWSDPSPAPHNGIGLFGGAYMPSDIDSLFNFTLNDSFSAAQTGGDLNYTAATGSYDLSQINVGDFVIIRFDFNVVPQIANTTVEVGLIWQTRNNAGTPTFTFPLTAQPIFFGTGTVGVAYLNRPIITAYMASQEDVNAVALPAIRSDNPVLIQPLATLIQVSR